MRRLLSNYTFRILLILLIAATGLGVLSWAGAQQDPATHKGNAATSPTADKEQTSAVETPKQNSSISLLDRMYRQLHNVENWLLVGLVLVIGRLGAKLARPIRAPAVVGYLLIGVLLGKSVFNFIDVRTAESLELITNFGLAIVAFMIGTELSRSMIRRLGKKLLVIMVTESLVAFALVALLIGLLGEIIFHNGELALAGALIFGAMAPASAPAGTVAVIQEYKARGPLTSMLLGVVGLDDGFAILLYAFAAAMAKYVLGGVGTSILSFFWGPCIEILGALVLGGVVGILLRAILRFAHDRADVLTLSLGAILITTGVAIAMHLSLILANLVVGAVLANVSTRQTERSYGAIDSIVQPVFVLFFVLAGAHLDLRLLTGLGLIGGIYIVGRVCGLVGGAYVGARISRASPTVRKYLGLGILSQAGVAIGLALTASHELREPQYGQLGQQLANMTITTITATTIVFEIIGPVTTWLALSRAGEIPAGESLEGDQQ